MKDVNGKEFVLGNKVKDTVTGFTGIATAHSKYLNGCEQISITGEVQGDDNVRVMEIDIQQIKYVGLGVVKKKKTKSSGGPSRMSTATRTI